MNIQDFLNKLKNAVYGSEVKMAIHDAIKKVYDDAAEAGNANMEVEMARGTEPTLNDRLGKMDDKDQEVTAQLDQKASKQELSALGKLELSGEFNTLTDLESAYPDGAEGLYLVIDDGYVYRWTGAVWVQTTQFQSTGIAENTIDREKTTFARLGKNKFDGQYLDLYLSGGLNNGTVENGDGKVAIKKLTPGQTYTISKSSDTNRFRIAGAKTFPKPGDTLTNYWHDAESTDPVKTFTLGIDEPYLLVYVSNADENKRPAWLQIEEGTSATPYAPARTVIDFEKDSIDVEAVPNYRPNGYLSGDPDCFEINMDDLTITTKAGGTFVQVGQKAYGFPARTYDLNATSDNSVAILYDSDIEDFLIVPILDADDEAYKEMAYIGFVRKNKKAYFVNGMFKDTTASQPVDSDSVNLAMVGDSGEDYEPLSTGEVTADITNTWEHTQIYEQYNQISSSQFDVTRSTLGNSHNGTPIYRYDSKPLRVNSYIGEERRLPKIIVTVNIHGHEKQVAQGALTFFKDLNTKWKEQKALQFIKANAHLIFIPIVNPDGYDNSSQTADGENRPAGRKNGNGVDLNRNFGPNFGTSGSTDPENWMYRGESEASEVETQLLMQLLADESDALYLIDYHNYGSFPGVNDVYYVNTDNIQNRRIQLAQGQYLDTKYRRDYDALTLHNHNLASVRAGLANSWANYAETQGFNTILLESVTSIGTTNEEVVKLNADVLGNTILTVLRHWKEYMNQ